MELSPLGPSVPCPISTCCRDVVNLRPPPSPPPAAEIPREEVAVEELAVPERPLEGLQKEELKDAASGGQDLVAAVPKELDREPIPGLCRAAACTDRSHPVALPRKTVVESACKGRTASCQRSSSRQKFYRCVVCGKNFLLKINLIIHQRSHSNWRPYCCPACGKGFIQKHHLQKHQRIHGRLYRCIECAESFPLQASLEEHQRRHTQQRPFQCSGCSKSFRHRQSLNHHQKVHAAASPPAAGVPGLAAACPAPWDGERSARTQGS
uniref:C2H2-type domain-containing protein n=1 Tax=Anas platyrhynchos TaxID=8839 RepID=A0A8B9T6D9_ANAPL